MRPTRPCHCWECGPPVAWASGPRTLAVGKGATRSRFRSLYACICARVIPRRLSILPYLRELAFRCKSGLRVHRTPRVTRLRIHSDCALRVNSPCEFIQANWSEPHPPIRLEYGALWLRLQPALGAQSGLRLPELNPSTSASVCRRLSSPTPQTFRHNRQYRTLHLATARRMPIWRSLDPSVHSGSAHPTYLPS